MWIEYRPVPGEGPEPKRLPHYELTLVPGEPKKIDRPRGEALIKAFAIELDEAGNVVKPGRIVEVDKPADESDAAPAPKKSKKKAGGDE